MKLESSLIIELGMMINKSDRDIIRKRLEEIDKKKPNSRQRRRLLEELTKIFHDLHLKENKLIVHLIVLVIMV